MSEKGFLKRHFEHAQEDYDNELEMSKSFHHSSFYHRYFEGYSEVKVQKEGRKHNTIKRVYVGSFYKRDCSDRAWIKCKIVYGMSYVLALALFLFGMTRPVDSNRTFYAGGVTSLATVAFIVLFVRVLECVFKSRQMTVYQFSSSFDGLTKKCYLTAGLLVLNAVAVFANGVVTGNFGFENLLPAIMAFISAVIIGAVGRMEQKAEYLEIKNENQEFSQGVIIS